MLSLIFLYILAILSGYSLTIALQLPTHLARWIVASAVSSAQLVVSIQVLSLFRLLDGLHLVALNALLTAVMVVFVTKLIRTVDKLPAATPTASFDQKIASIGRFEWCTIVVCAGAVLVYSGLAGVGFPKCDPYHFTMPLFWKQQGTILPAPTYDPRINGVVFASEAISFPGVLLAQTGAMFVVFASLAGAFLLWIVAAISRQLGASTKATFGVVATLGGCSVYSISIQSGQADILMATLWLAGSLYLLLEAHRCNARRTVLLASSAFCFAMAAGAKNVILLHALPYGIMVILLLGSSVLRLGSLMKAIVLPGIAGALASGLVWSYTANHFWYGDMRGHAFLRETLSKDFSPAGVWTRYCRGLVTFASDIAWVPSKYQAVYADTCHRGVRLLGGAERLAEDSGFYAFEKSQIRPGQGLGLAGPFIVLPGLALALVVAVRDRSRRDDQSRAIRGMLVFSFASLFIFFTVLRWQSIGILRLMLSCLAAVTPLCFLWLEWRWSRMLALATAVVSIGLYSIWGLGLRLRLVDPESKLFLTRALDRLQRPHTTKMDFRWTGETVQALEIRDPVWRREIYELALKRIPQPAVLGILGGYNAQVYWLFGEQFSNRVVPLNDCRMPLANDPPPDDVQYLVVEDFPMEHVNPRVVADFEPWLEIEDANAVVWRCLRRRAPSIGAPSQTQ